MPTIKNHDFVEIEYTGRTREDNAIFDTTEEKVAKENGVYDKGTEYRPLVVCIGEYHMLKALEEQLIGKEAGKEYTFEIKAEDAFGRKDAKLIQLIPLSKFKQQNIQPFPGLHLNIDGVFGIVKTVSGGRCLVDFNHPLAGKDLLYNVKINKIVEGAKEKINSLLKTHLQVKDAEIDLKEDAVEIKIKEKISDEADAEFKKAISKTVPNIKNVSFTILQEKK